MDIFFTEYEAHKILLKSNFNILCCKLHEQSDTERKKKEAEGWEGGQSNLLSVIYNVLSKYLDMYACIKLFKLVIDIFEYLSLLKN